MPQSEEDQYHDLIEELTYINEEPDSVGNIDGLTDVQQKDEDLVNEGICLVEPSSVAEPPLPPPDKSSPGPPGAGPSVSTSLLGRFSRVHFQPPSPSISPSELSSAPEQPPARTASPARITRNATPSDSHPSHTTLLLGKRSRTSSHAEDNRRRQKARRRDDESDSDSDWEPRAVARRTRSTTRTTSRRDSAPRASTTRPALRSRPQRTTKGRQPAVRGGAHGSSAPTNSLTGGTLHDGRHGRTPASDFTSHRPLGLRSLSDGSHGPDASAAHAQPVSSLQSSKEVDLDDTMSPLSDATSSTLPTPPPIELQYLFTGIEEYSATYFDIPKDRASKIKDRHLIKHGASSDPRAPRRALPATVPPSHGRHHTVNTELEGDTEGTTDSDDGDGDYEEGIDSSAPPTRRPLPPRRKGKMASMKHKRKPRAGKKTTSRGRSAKNASAERHTYFRPDGKEYEYTRGWSDARRKMLKYVHGPLWCLFYQETAPAPEGNWSQFSRVRDSPKRHLETCPSFKNSRFYERKAQEGIPHEDVVKAAVDERKAAGSIIRCPNDVIQQTRLAKYHFTHGEVLYELWRLSTVFKDVDCDCCDLPLYSEFCQEL